MEDIYLTGTGKWSSDPRRAADVLPIHEDPDVPTQLAGLVPDPEPKARVAILENVQELLDRSGIDLLPAPGAELSKPAIQVHIEHGGLLGSNGGGS